MPFKMHKIIYFFPEKIKNNVGLPYLKFSNLLPEKTLFYLALQNPWGFQLYIGRHKHAEYFLCNTLLWVLPNFDLF